MANRSAVDKLSMFYFKEKDNPLFMKKWRSTYVEFLRTKTSSSHSYMYSMYHDMRRLNFYRRSLEKVCKDKIVIEIGTGAGLVSVLAIQAGAKKVIAFESNPRMVEVAKKTFENNGVSSKIELVPKSSLEVDENDYPKADIILHELFGSDPFGEDVLPIISDAKRFCHENTIFLPEKLEVHLEFCESSDKRHFLNELPMIDGVNTESLREFQARKQNYSEKDFKLDYYVPISDKENLFLLDFSNIDSFIQSRRVKIGNYSNRERLAAGVSFSFYFQGEKYSNCHQWQKEVNSEFSSWLSLVFLIDANWEYLNFKVDLNRIILEPSKPVRGENE